MRAVRDRYNAANLRRVTKTVLQKYNRDNWDLSNFSRNNSFDIFICDVTQRITMQLGKRDYPFFFSSL